MNAMQLKEHIVVIVGQNQRQGFAVLQHHFNCYCLNVSTENSLYKHLFGNPTLFLYHCNFLGSVVTAQGRPQHFIQSLSLLFPPPDAGVILFLPSFISTAALYVLIFDVLPPHSSSFTFNGITTIQETLLKLSHFPLPLWALTEASGGVHHFQMSSLKESQPLCYLLRRNTAVPSTGSTPNLP